MAINVLSLTREQTYQVAKDCFENLPEEDQTKLLEEVISDDMKLEYAMSWEDRLQSLNRDGD